MTLEDRQKPVQLRMEIPFRTWEKPAPPEHLRGKRIDPAHIQVNGGIQPGNVSPTEGLHTLLIGIRTRCS